MIRVIRIVRKMKQADGVAWVGLVAFALTVGGCGSSTSASSTEDYSTSGTVASMVGGAYSSAGGSGSMAYLLEPAYKRPFQWANWVKQGLSMNEAWASTACPTVSADSAAGCTAGTDQVTMAYNNCSFGSNTATWSGSQIISATGITCASMPTDTDVTRTFGSGTVRTAASGTSVELDTSGALQMTLSGSTGISADGTAHTGGTVVSFSGGVRTGIAVNGVNYIGKNANGNEIFSHTLYTDTPLTITGGNTVNGTVSVIHNLVKVKATSVLKDVVFTSGCCQPTGGEIDTTFTALSGAGSKAQSFTGTTETLSFTGCGTATYSGPENYRGAVKLSHCL